jgi:hypothetical protein
MIGIVIAYFLLRLGLLEHHPEPNGYFGKTKTAKLENGLTEKG